MSLSRGNLLETWTYSRFQPWVLISPSWGNLMKTWTSSRFQIWISMSPSRGILLETWTSSRFQHWILMTPSQGFLMEIWTSCRFQLWVLMSTIRGILLETGHLVECNQGSWGLQVVEFCWRQDIWQISTMGLHVCKSRNSVGDRTSGRFQPWVLISPSRGILLEN